MTINSQERLLLQIKSLLYLRLFELSFKTADLFLKSRLGTKAALSLRLYLLMVVSAHGNLKFKLAYALL